MFFTADHLRGFTTFTMLKKTRFSTTVIDTLHGIPAAVKQYHPDTETWRYETERDILLELNGKWRTPRLLAGDDREKILSIEWLPGDRLKEYLIQRYLQRSDPDTYRDGPSIRKSLELFQNDRSPETMNIKTQIFSIIRLLHRYGVVHGDVDARNFIVSPEGLVYIIDFSNGSFSEPGSERFKSDLEAMQQKFGIDYDQFCREHKNVLEEKYYQSSMCPNGLITTGDGQGCTSRKFRHLGIRSLEGLSFLDIGCAEGEICRHAAKRGARRCTGVDISAEAVGRGNKINRFYDSLPVQLQEADFRDFLLAHESNSFDVITCFSVLHHLVPEMRENDLLSMVTRPEHTAKRSMLVELINGILARTRLAFFLELPFNYGELSGKILETGQRFCENISPELDGVITSLGIWHANYRKARFVFRLDRPGLDAEQAGRLMLSDPVLDAWRLHVPMTSDKADGTRIPSTARAGIGKQRPGFIRRLKRFVAGRWKRK